MKRIIIILLLIFTLGCTSENEKKELNFRISYGVPIVYVQINGKTAKMIIDTGASLSIINKDSKKEYGFEIGKDIGTLEGIGGVASLWEIKNIKVTIRDSIISHKFYVADISNLKNSRGIDGIIGSDYFKSKNMVIDFYNNKLYKYKSN